MGAVEAYHIEGIDAWDVAAGKLIIEEAGGVVIDTTGRYYSCYLHIIPQLLRIYLSDYSNFETC